MMPTTLPQKYIPLTGEEREDNMMATTLPQKHTPLDWEGGEIRVYVKAR